MDSQSHTCKFNGRDESEWLALQYWIEKRAARKGTLVEMMESLVDWERQRSAVDGALKASAEHEEFARKALDAIVKIKSVDRTPEYKYGEALPNGDLPGPGARFCTPREMAKDFLNQHAKVARKHVSMPVCGVSDVKQKDDRDDLITALVSVVLQAYRTESEMGKALDFPVHFGWNGRGFARVRFLSIDRQTRQATLRE